MDAMGRDTAPNDVLSGMNKFLFQNGEDVAHLSVFGDEAQLKPLMATYPRV